ncbi:MAG: methyltransferase domain-containing protein [bacterium]
MISATTLQCIEDSILPAASNNIPELFNEIDIADFGELLLMIPDQYPRMKQFFPAMPSNEIQTQWTGSFGNILLAQSCIFVRSMVEKYQKHSRRALAESKVLDYGIGWGRISRLMYKFVPVGNLYGVDAWQESINICNECKLLEKTALVDEYPKSLPFSVKFDLIYAFSLFTHLSQKCGQSILKVLRQNISKDGLLFVTIRPKEYWDRHLEFSNNRCDVGVMKSSHESLGFAYAPHNRPNIDGDVPYGDASMSLEFIKLNWVEWGVVESYLDEGDIFQTIVVLKPV